MQLDGAIQHESWRIVLFTDFPGMYEFYEQYFTERGHRIVGIVTSPKRGLAYLDIVKAARPTIDVIVSNHPKRWADMLRPLCPDLIVSTIFPWRIPKGVIDLPRLGAVNVHPSALPKYRGTDTPLWMLRNGESQWGASLHRLGVDFDTGPILAQVRFEVSDDEDLVSVMPKLQATLPPLWEAALPRIAAGDPGNPQDESQASYCGRIPDLEAWRRVDWSDAARAIHNQVRSCVVPWEAESGALATIDGVRVRVLRTRLVAGIRSNRATPGTVLNRENGTLLVQCGDAPLQVISYQPV